MKFTTLQAVLGATVVLLSASPSLARGHHHLPHVERSIEHRHVRLIDHASAPVPIKKRGGSCAFPTNDPNMVAVTPDEKNAGWAMSPDQSCEPGHYCPFACKPGMVMAQWDPDSTYDYPASMNGGLYCNDNGEIEKPFEDKPNCVDGTGAVKVVNKCGSKMSWCQTVLPGNEAMLIPTVVTSSAILAVPDSSYWCSTAAHFYINPPGVGDEGCIWGDDSQPVGNWSPYVAGANTESDGTSYVKLGWNPIWEDSGLKSELPNFGVEVTCPDGGCNGLPCRIDPKKGQGNVESDEGGVGAGNSAFCVVTVQKGKTAQIVAFGAGSVLGVKMNAEASSESEETSSSAPESTVEPTTSTPEPTTSEEPTTTSLPPTTTSTTSTTPTSTSTSTTSIWTPTSTKTSTTTTSTTTKASKTLQGGIFHENGTSISKDHHRTTTQPIAASATLTEAAPTTSKEGEAGRQQGSAAVVGLVVAFIAAAFFY